MSRMKRLLSIVMLLALCMCAATAGAATTSADGVTLTLTTDKQAYEAGDRIEAELTISNNSAAVISGISIDYVKPDFCVEENAAKTVRSVAGLSAGQEVKLDASFLVVRQNAAMPATGDDTHMFFWLLLGGVSVFALARMNAKTRRQMMAVVLCLAVAGGMLPLGAISTARAENIGFGDEIRVSEKIVIMGRETELVAVVKYVATENSAARALAAPTGIDVSCTSSTQGVVHWGAVSGATGYEILQSRTKTGTYTVTAEKTGGTTKTITFLTSSGINYVKVRAYKTVNGVREYGDESAPRLVFPVGIVDGVSATVSSTSGNVVLKWNTTANAHKYKIFASDTENGTYTDVVTVLAKTTATQSASLSPTLQGKYLKIRTVRDDEGTRSHSAYSTPVKAEQAIALAAPTGIDVSCTSSTQGVVHWGAVSGATGYEIYQSLTKTGAYTKSAEKEGGTTKTITFLTSSGVNYVKVRAYKTVNGVRQYGEYSEPRLVFPVGIVDGVSATISSSSGNVVLKWNTTANAHKYKIFASDTENGTYTDVVTVLAKTTATQSASLNANLKDKYFKIRTVRDDQGTRSHSAYSTPVKVEQLEFTYTIAGGKATITGYIGSKTAVVVPDTIGGAQVTAIAASAFANKTGITSVTLPDAVTSIGAGAFSGCTGLESIRVPSGVTVIEDNTFNGCTKLERAELPNAVTRIGKRAFYNCTSLKNMTTY